MRQAHELCGPSYAQGISIVYKRGIEVEYRRDRSQARAPRPLIVQYTHPRPPKKETPRTQQLRQPRPAAQQETRRRVEVGAELHKGGDLAALCLREPANFIMILLGGWTLQGREEVKRGRRRREDGRMGGWEDGRGGGGGGQDGDARGVEGGAGEDGNSGPDAGDRQTDVDRGVDTAEEELGLEDDLAIRDRDDLARQRTREKGEGSKGWGQVWRGRVRQRRKARLAKPLTPAYMVLLCGGASVFVLGRKN
ncbi:hypothetical protein K438DRAFT_1748121 [Mycena galopus ATCC 62051]|nr:hypothetical protein K438DRAFT_1748121 [Mycena galopus ATCC 62051]